MSSLASDGETHLEEELWDQSDAGCYEIRRKFRFVVYTGCTANLNPSGDLATTSVILEGVR